MGRRCTHPVTRVRIWVTGWVDVEGQRVVDVVEPVETDFTVTCLDCGTERETMKGPWPKWAREAVDKAAPRATSLDVAARYNMEDGGEPAE